MVIGQVGKNGVLARYFPSIDHASFQPEREHANATIAIIIALARIKSAKSAPVPTDISWVKMNGYHASKNLLQNPGWPLLTWIVRKRGIVQYG